MYDDYIGRYERGRRSLGSCIVPILLIIAIIAGIFSFIAYNSEKNYTITVTRVTVKNNNNQSKYLVFGDDENGKSQVFEITDNWLRFRFDSSDLWGKIKEGETYDIKTIGWRVQFFSWYENIISAEEIE